MTRKRRSVHTRLVGTIPATCRWCGAPVTYFGDLCPADAAVAAESGDDVNEAWNAAVRADTYNLAAKAAEEDY